MVRHKFQNKNCRLRRHKEQNNSKTKAIVIVHLYGYAVDFRNIINFVRKKY